MSRVCAACGKDISDKLDIANTCSNRCRTNLRRLRAREIGRQDVLAELPLALAREIAARLPGVTK